MIFALPDMEKLLDENVTSILNFEHTFLLSDKYIRYLLRSNGYEICEISRFGNGHSIIYDTIYTGIKEKVAIENYYFTNRKIICQYFQNQKNMVENWNQRIEQSHENVYLFGAHISSQYYAAYGLEISEIKAILDNDAYKIGKCVCGIDKEVISPKELKGSGRNIVIVPPSPYASEIKKGILEINEKIVFI